MVKDYSESINAVDEDQAAQRAKLQQNMWKQTEKRAENPIKKAENAELSGKHGGICMQLAKMRTQAKRAYSKFV